MSDPVVVYKLGGSLLDWPEFPARLGALLRKEEASVVPVVVTGGGAAADAVRRWDGVHGLSAERAHELAIAAMDLNARLVRIALRDLGFSICDHSADLRPGQIFVPDMEAELLRAGSDVPPATWDVTSDSLAAWLAHRLGACRLVLLKSVEAPQDERLSTAAANGLIDSCLPDVARGLQVVWLNLRGEAMQSMMPMANYR